ncbi:hypothetical protein BH11MYX1_BH11MYX1_37180 [soil metagenome]
MKLVVIAAVLACCAVVAETEARADVSTIAPMSTDSDVASESLVTTGQTIGGSVAGLTLGFGTGHLIEGRWRERGWIFTVGEGLAVGVMTATSGDALVGAIFDRANIGTVGFLASAAVFAGLRVWEAEDVIACPHFHNARVRAARQRMLVPVIAPRPEGGTTAGLAMSFSVFSSYRSTSLRTRG